jgi:hypothetical protein
MVFRRLHTRVSEIQAEVVYRHFARAQGVCDEKVEQLAW